MRVLSLCDHSGVMVKPWVDAGHEAVIVDLKHTTNRGDGRLIRIGMDVIDLTPGHAVDYDIVFAFPPCTDLAVSGARWFRDKGLRSLIDALTLVEHCRILCESSGAPWMLENPAGVLSSYWRQPDFTFNPCDYGGYLDPPGDAYTKKTCLWAGGGFRMPPKRPVGPTEGSRMHLLSPSPDRAEKRSLTPAGFARAVFEANAPASRGLPTPTCAPGSGASVLVDQGRPSVSAVIPPSSG